MLTKEVRVLVLRTAGINRDSDMMIAWEKAGAKADLRHINELTALDPQELLDQYAIVALPGGFAYGDDLGAGKLLANDLLYRLQEPFARFVESERPLLGVCNGFQVLAKMGLLGSVTLLPNTSEKFECRWTWLQNTSDNKCLFTQDIERLYVPLAHGEGRVALGGEDPALTLQQFEVNHQVVFKYCDEEGNTNAGYPFNPNGSVANIAGICNAKGTIFGLMPHPENFVSALQHPRWTRFRDSAGRLTLTEGAGLKIFKNAVEYILNN